MRQFKYRFEKILSLRRHKEKEKQRELAEVRKLEQEQNDRIENIHRDRGLQLERERDCLVGNIDPQRLSGYTRYLLLLRQLEFTGRKALEQICKEAEKRRLVLVEATKQKKIYEKLKERQFEKYIEEYNRLVQKETDENGQKLFFRKRS